MQPFCPRAEGTDADSTPIYRGDILFTLLPVGECRVSAVTGTPTPPKALVVYYYPDDETAFHEDERVREESRRAFSKNGARHLELDSAYDFCGERWELAAIKEKWATNPYLEEEVDNISEILCECPSDYEFIVINNV